MWTGEGPNAVQANAYRTSGQLVVSTPGRVAQALQNGLIQTTLLSKTLSMFVLDEADLLLLHEYETDLQAIAPQVRTHNCSAPSPPIILQTCAGLTTGWYTGCISAPQAMMQLRTAFFSARLLNESLHASSWQFAIANSIYIRNLQCTSSLWNPQSA